MNGARLKYAGVLSILRYNAPFYVASLASLIGLGALLGFMRLPLIAELIVIAGAIVTAFWSVSSLAASYYIYDYVGVNHWNWVPSAMSRVPRRWLNVHAGLDQSTDKLTQLFPNTEHTVLDIYDPHEMTEPSIARARRTQPASDAVAAKLNALPLGDKDRDAVFVLFSAHEVRQSSRRTEFFRELSRVMADSGELMLVEHLRDWKNFVAFGPGFLHFFSRKEWLRVAREAGLTVARERRMTPMVRCFVLQKLGT